MVEGSWISGSNVGTAQKLAEEECCFFGSKVQPQTFVAHNLVSQKVGLEVVHAQSSCSGPMYPPGVENVCQLVESSRLAHWETKQKESDQCTESVEETVSEQGTRLVEDRVLQTPSLGSCSKLQSEDIEAMIPWEESLVEAKVTWDIGKKLGLKARNELAVIEALARGPECLDVVIPRKRGRPKKKKGIPKD